MSKRPGNNFRIGKSAIGTLLLSIALFALFLGNGTARAQELYGTLTGTVSDKTGAVVPNETVTVTSQTTGEVRTEVTKGLGEYLFRNLLPGVYTVSIPRKGNFAGFTEKDVAISASQDRRVDISLTLATVTAEITVDTAPPAMQTESAEVDHEISETQLDELPVTSTQGRNFQSLYTIVPGAAGVAEQNSTASNPSRAMSVNVNGVEDMSNTTRIDGAVNTYGWLPYLIAYVPPADSIESINIATNSFNAEQGVAGGASINITVKSGTRNFHGSTWEYYQDAAFNSRAYTSTKAALTSITDPSGAVPKNVFDQFGFSIGGPVYIPKILTGKKKLFFFQDFERTTRRQLIAGTQNVPDSKMITGDFSEVASLPKSAAGYSQSVILYDPQPMGVGPYLAPAARPTFMSEYGCNCIPASRQSTAAQKMLSLLSPIASTVGTPTASQLLSGLSQDYVGSGTFAYNRNTSDSKITYLPNDNTTIFGRYSIEPFTVLDPQELGAAGGGTFDGGQPGLGHGRIQNIGLGFSHVLTPTMVLDADWGYTRQLTGAQSAIDIADGDYGLNVLGIPGTNGTGIDYAGQPEFVMNGGSTQFSSIGNSNGANPFLFRDNQYTGDVNFSWTKGKHSTKYGFTYYQFGLNHFQPTSGGGVSSPRGGFNFQGGLTTGPADVDPNKGTANNITNYLSLADFLLGLPNNGTGIAVAKETQGTDPNSLRWKEFAGYAQDQWTATPKLTVNYGLRYEMYPAITRDHSGVAILDPTLPVNANVELGGINGNPKNAGLDMGWGFIAPRLGLAYRITPKMVIRSGAGLTSDPDSLRFMRDSFPEDVSPTYSGTASDTIAVDSNNNNHPMTLSYGIPAPIFPTINSAGYAGLPVTGSTNTARKNYRRGYIESWNLFLEQDLGNSFIANFGYVGTHQVRQLTGITLDAAPVPSNSTPCMANGQYNPTSGYATSPDGSGKNPCSFQANTIINQEHCTVATGAVCYNTGGITMNEPLFSANYNGMQAQLTRNAGKQSSFGLVYTWSHAFDYEDNGAGSGSAGTADSYPAYFKLERGAASYDRTHNVQFWGIYHLPFGHGMKYANQGLASVIFGGFQLNGQFSHISGAPFSVSPSSSALNSPGNTLYAELVAPYHQIGGHNRTVGNTSVSGGKAWFDPTSFANPTEPTYSATQLAATVVPTVFSNTHRMEFRGPGQTQVNASAFRGFHIYREAEFQARFEAFNVFNHPILGNPNTTVGGSTFGYITSFSGSRTVQFSGRFNF
jgi:hypothetical protein